MCAGVKARQGTRIARRDTAVRSVGIILPFRLKAESLAGMLAALKAEPVISRRTTESGHAPAVFPDESTAKHHVFLIVKLIL